MHTPRIIDYKRVLTLPHNTRLVFGLETIDTNISRDQRIPVSQIKSDKLTRGLKSSLDYLKKFQGIVGAKPHLVYRDHRVSENEILELINTIPPRKEGKVRIAICETDIDIGHVRDDPEALFIFCGSGRPSYDQKADAGVFKISCRAKHAPFFILDYFCEMFIGNGSYPIRYFVDSVENSHVKLYRKKNTFTSEIRDQFPDRMGLDKSRIEYTCFANALRTKANFYDRTLLRSVVENWDRFILSNFRPTDEQTLQAISKWPRVGGHLNIEKIGRELRKIECGTYLLAVQRKSSGLRTRAESFERVHALIGKGIPRHGSLAKGFSFLSTKSDLKELNWAVDSGYIQVLRIWK